MKYTEILTPEVIKFSGRSPSPPSNIDPSAAYAAAVKWSQTSGINLPSVSPPRSRSSSPPRSRVGVVGVGVVHIESYGSKNTSSLTKSASGKTNYSIERIQSPPRQRSPNGREIDQQGLMERAGALGWGSRPSLPPQKLGNLDQLLKF